MTYSFTKIWIHAIWSTKEQKPLIAASVEPLLHEFLVAQFKLLGCHVKSINGSGEHVHCLFDLRRGRSLASVLRQVKGSSSHFLNTSGLLDARFSWDPGYAAFSVSEPGSSIVAAYINGQKEYHRQKKFSEEYNTFLKIHGFPDML